MEDDWVRLERQAAVKRLAYWQAVYEAAVASHDEDTAAHARRFIREYDQFLVELKRERGE